MRRFLTALKQLYWTIFDRRKDKRVKIDNWVDLPFDIVPNSKPKRRGARRKLTNRKKRT